MKKIVYIAPLALLGIGVKTSANQVPTHISNALRVYEQEHSQTQTASQSMRQAKTERVGQNGSTFSNYQNQPIGKAEETTHISRLDDGLIDEDSSVGNEQASQVMKINRAAIPTRQELNESKESVAGQYVQVQQNRVAQFNKGSKIYGLNNSSQLSKNNGDGYVITNAGKYDGRDVDIAVTINNVNEQQGSYTTKWSNGDKADVTGKTDARFKYDNDVLPGMQQNAVTVPNKTKKHIETQNISEKLNGVWVQWSESYSAGSADNHMFEPTLIDPAAIARVMQLLNCDESHAIYALLTGHREGTYSANLGTYDNFLKRKWRAYSGGDFDGATINTKYFKCDRVFYDDNTTSANFSNQWADPGRTYWSHYQLVDPNFTLNFKNFGPAVMNNAAGFSGIFCIGSDNDITLARDGKIKSALGYTQIYGSPYGEGNVYDPDDRDTINSVLNHISSKGYNFNVKKNMNVTAHLQLDSTTPASLNYNYTVGVYDAQTGELIKDLTAEYKGKTGKMATDKNSIMNNAVKAKIQAINANTANAAYTGTAANDDVAFNKNTVHVNYVDTRGESINVPGYDIDVDNLTSGNYQVPQNYTLVNPNGFKVTKNTHEVNGVTVTDSYNFIDQGNNKVTDNGKALNVVLTDGTKNVDPIHSKLSNDATNDVFVINNGAKRQINSQSRHFGASGMLDLVTNKITRQGDWQLFGKSNFDQTNINNDLIGYGNAIHSNLTFLAL